MFVTDDRNRHCLWQHWSSTRTSDHNVCCCQIRQERRSGTGRISVNHDVLGNGILGARYHSRREISTSHPRGLRQSGVLVEVTTKLCDRSKHHQKDRNDDRHLDELKTTLISAKTLQVEQSSPATPVADSFDSYVHGFTYL